MTSRKGDRVFTNNFEFATVIDEPGSNGWFRVETDDGRKYDQNDERVITPEQARARFGKVDKGGTE